MTQTSIGGSIFMPPNPIFQSNVPNFSTPTIDASGELHAAIFNIPRTGTLDKFEFRLGAVTQAPGNGLRCSFRDVDLATGDPEATPDDQFRVVTAGLTANTWVVPGLITSDGTDGGTKRSVTRGDRIACVIGFESFTAGDSLQISEINTSGSAAFNSEAYTDLFTAAWIKRLEGGCIALKYDDGVYYFINPKFLPVSDLSVLNNITTATNPDEVALIFRPQVPMQVGGAFIHTEFDGDTDIVLYDVDGDTALQTATLDPDVRVDTSDNLGYAQFPAVQTVNAGSDYRLAIKHIGGIGNDINFYDVNSAALMAAMPMGANWRWSQRIDGLGWTETATRRPHIHLQIEGFDDGRLPRAGYQMGVM